MVSYHFSVLTNLLKPFIFNWNMSGNKHTVFLSTGTIRKNLIDFSFIELLHLFFVNFDNLRLNSKIFLQVNTEHVN